MNEKRGIPLYNQTYVNTGTGAPVILLHGLFGNLKLWKTVINALKKDYKVIVPRLPLFDLPSDHINIKYLVEVLHEFIEWSQLEKVTLVGHGVGGQIAAIYAHNHPENVERLVLTASSGLSERSPILDSDGDSGEYSYVHEKIQEAFYLTEFVTNELVDDIYATVKNIPNRNTLWNIARSSRHTSLAPVLVRITKPVLLLWGLQDTITTPEIALQFHDLLPNSQLKFIDRCGYVPMVEQSEEFNKNLIRFLESH